jgi:prolipoprotein diacylglyceryl transferase
VQPLASFPSPTRSVWHLGPLPIRAYAICIIIGIFVAIWLTLRRWKERGGTEEQLWDIAGWAILFGILGGRVYHVATDPELYFGSGKHPLDAFKIWDGGLGIWGAISLGAIGAWIGCRRKGVSLTVFADAAVPGVALAQGIGRWGNYFNNELYGGRTSLPWGLQVHCMDVSSGKPDPFGTADNGMACTGHALLPGLYQPTFLYECLWDIALALVLIYLDRRFRLGRGNVFALYAMGYTLGRGWIEALRHDHAHHLLGLRLNDWTSIVVFLIGLAWFLRHGGFHAEREASPYRRGVQRAPDPAAVPAGGPSTDTEDKEADVHGGPDDRPS